MYEFIRGPMAWACFSIFITGMLFQVIRFFLITRKMESLHLMRPSDPPMGKKPDNNRKFLPQLAAKLRVTIVGVDPLMTAVTLVFHVSIFMLPLFLSEHHMLLDVLWGFTFCPYVFPAIVADIITGMIFACILFFLFRRIFVSRVRSISTGYDYLILLVTAAPFATGFLTVHQFYDYRTIVILHVLSVNLILLALPFSKFVHSAFFFLHRFFIGSEYSFSKGSRRW